MDVEKEILEIYDRMQGVLDSVASLQKRLLLLEEKNPVNLETVEIVLNDVRERVERLEKTQAQDNGCVSKENEDG